MDSLGVVQQAPGDRRNDRSKAALLAMNLCLLASTLQPWAAVLVAKHFNKEITMRMVLMILGAALVAYFLVKGIQAQFSSNKKGTKNEK